MTVLTIPLVRTAGGAVVHRNDCVQVHSPVKSVPWLWAQDRDSEEVQRAMPLVGARACLHCHPFV